MLLKLFPFIKPYPLSGTPLDLKGRQICYFSNRSLYRAKLRRQCCPLWIKGTSAAEGLDMIEI